MKPDFPYSTHFYEHPRFKPGMVVFVDERIREIHDLSPVAGKMVGVTKGTYLSSTNAALQRMLDAEEAECSRYTKVPVIAENGEIYFVEEEYVRAV